MRLDLVVGPNGAGKSTFVRLTLAPVLPRSSFVNADLIAAQRWPDDAEAHAYDAARIAAATRQALLARRAPFIAETVFSHSSKLDLLRAAQSAGYYTALHVVLVPEELAVARVAAASRPAGTRFRRRRSAGATPGCGPWWPTASSWPTPPRSTTTPDAPARARWPSSATASPSGPRTGRAGHPQRSRRAGSAAPRTARASRLRARAACSSPPCRASPAGSRRRSTRRVEP